MFLVRFLWISKNLIICLYNWYYFIFLGFLCFLNLIRFLIFFGGSLVGWLLLLFWFGLLNLVPSFYILIYLAKLCVKCFSSIAFLSPPLSLKHGTPPLCGVCRVFFSPLLVYSFLIILFSFLIFLSSLVVFLFALWR